MNGRVLVFATLLGAATVIASCATDAQHRAQTINHRVADVMSRRDTCLNKVKLGSAYQIMTGKFLRTDETNLSKITDNTYASDEEIAAIYSVHAAAQGCRQIEFIGYSDVDPAIVTHLATLYRRLDEIYAKVTSKSFSWGEANKEYVRLREWQIQSQNELTVNMEKHLSIQHEAELRQRAEMDRALQQWSFQQQILYNQNRAVNALEKIRLTTCSAIGSGVSCITR